MYTYAENNAMKNTLFIYMAKTIDANKSMLNVPN